MAAGLGYRNIQAQVNGSEMESSAKKSARVATFSLLDFDTNVYCIVLVVGGWTPAPFLHHHQLNNIFGIAPVHSEQSPKR